MTSGGDSGDEVLISVVIGSFNGERTLAAALDALEGQLTSVNFETIVVNDASTDRTGDIARRPTVRLIDLEVNQGHGHTLNVGLAAARGRYLALMDDDCVPPPDWIEQLATAWSLVDDSVTMIGGLVVPLATDSFNRRYVAYRRPIVHQESEIDEHAGFVTRLRYVLAPPPPKEGRRAVYYTVGANMSVRVDAARLVGGFTEARGAGEEESLARPLRERYGAATVQLFPEIVMRHDFHPSLQDTLRRSRSYGRTHGRDWLRDRDIPTLAPLPLLAGLVAALVAVVSPVTALFALVLSPFALYRRWFRQWREDGAESLAFPYVQAAEDIASDVGFVQGLVGELRRRRHGDPTR